MNKQSLSILLILMMLITPIASAFEHCSGMDMSGNLSESQSLTVTMSADDASPLSYKQMLMGQQNNQTGMDCQNSCSCAIHVCGGYGISPSAPTVNTVTASYYSGFEYTSPYSTPLAFHLRPPILIL